ncbi:hypothetical protein [Chitinimonas koreensis]|uniref:hypothetical protein n=1 Tax=Chitinimonas koreensis TaxID=356302 RepID=UPI000491D528|nr:hypothetical protein [Chitinimonas koreensis]
MAGKRGLGTDNPIHRVIAHNLRVALEHAPGRPPRLRAAHYLSTLLGISYKTGWQILHEGTDSLHYLTCVGQALGVDYTDLLKPAADYRHVVRATMRLPGGEYCVSAVRATLPSKPLCDTELVLQEPLKGNWALMPLAEADPGLPTYTVAHLYLTTRPAPRERCTVGVLMQGDPRCARMIADHFAARGYTAYAAAHAGALLRGDGGGKPDLAIIQADHAERLAIELNVHAKAAIPILIVKPERAGEYDRAARIFYTLAHVEDMLAMAQAVIPFEGRADGIRIPQNRGGR